jgi:hypothetical protein
MGMMHLSTRRDVLAQFVVSGRLMVRLTYNSSNGRSGRGHGGHGHRLTAFTYQPRDFMTSRVACALAIEEPGRRSSRKAPSQDVKQVKQDDHYEWHSQKP